LGQIAQRPQVGFLLNYAEQDAEAQVRSAALRGELEKLGWTDGRNIKFEHRWAEGNPEKIAAYAAEFVGRRMDVLVGNSTPVAKAMERATVTTPIVFVQVTDPVGAGLVQSMARPGGNITGFADYETQTAAKWIELLHEAVPSLRRITVLMHPDTLSQVAFWRVIEAAAPSLGKAVSAAGIRRAADIEGAISALAGQRDTGLIVLPQPVSNTLRRSIIALATRHKLPAIYPYRYYTADGGLISYGVEQIDQWPGAGQYVDRILRGAKPGALPVQAPTRFKLVINLKTADALGLKIASNLLVRADEVLE